MGEKRTGLTTEKTRFRLYKAKHQWVIAGATVITIAALGFSKPSAVRADATSPSAADAVAEEPSASAQAVTLKVVTRTIHFVDETGKTVSTDVVQSAHFASNDDGQTWQQTDSQLGFAAIAAAAVNGMTAEQDQVPAAKVAATDPNSDVTVHYAQAAAAVTNADLDAASQKTETAVKAGDTATAAAAKAAAVATNADTAAAKPITSAPTVSYKSLLGQTSDSRGTASLTVNGQTSIEEVYAGLTGYPTTKPVSGTQDKDKLSIVASNLVKGDKLTITLPNFKAIDSAPNLSGATKVQTTNTVTYTVTTDTLSSLGFDMQIQAAYWPAKPQLVYQDNATVAVNKNVTGQVAMKATYRLADVSGYSLYQGHDDIHDSYSYAGSSKVPSDIQVGDDFVRWIDLGYETGLTVAEYNNLTITMPVPTTYQLDTAATQQFNTATTHLIGNDDDDLTSVWDVSQASVGAPVVFTLNKAASPATAKLNRPLFLVGKFTSGEGTQTASTPASVSGDTVYGHIQGTFDTFKATIVGDPAVKYEVSAKPVTNYVGPTDVGTYNVMNSSWLTLDVTKSMKQPVNMTFKVPANMIGTGLKVSSSSPADALYGLTATLTAYDANGAVLATADLNSLARDSSAVYTWMPDTDTTIATFGVNFTSLPNTSYSQVKLAPILAVATPPNGSQTYTIPTTSEIGGTTTNLTDYQVIVTDSHAITSAGPHLDGSSNNGPYQPGDPLRGADKDAAFSFYPFDQWDLTTYNILDQPSVYFVPLLDHATFVSTDKFKDNTSVVTLNGHRYLRIDVPAGYSVNDSLNKKYNTSVEVNHIQINMKVNADVTPDTQIKMGDSKQEPVFMGINDDNIDANAWTTSGGRIWTFDQLRQAGWGDVATLLQNAGYTKAYLDELGRQSALSAGKIFQITAPTELMLDTGIKADAEDAYVSGDGDTASFYPDDLTGSIREYIYNGGANTNLDYHGLVTLPKKADGDAYSLDLTGPITVPAGVTVQYSTGKVTGTDGQALSATQLASFTDGSVISDWGSVKSILFTVPTLANKASVNVEFPVKVTDTPTDAATAKALVFNYTKAQDGTILGAKTADLNTRVAEAQRIITVKYQDEDGNTLAADRTIMADAGSKLTLKPMMITGYKPKQDSQEKDYTVTREPHQTVTFTYEQTPMSVIVNFINVLTNKDAKKPLTLQGNIGDPLFLTEDTYTKIDGYTALPDNATKYTITTSQIQNINLYFTPETVPFTVNFVDDADHSKALATAQKFDNGIVGYEYPVTAATVAGYTPTKTSDNLTLSTTQNSYTFYYKANPQTLTIHYVDESGHSLHPDTTAATTTNAAYDLKSTVDNVAIAGYERETPDADLKGTATIGADGKLVKSEVTVTYRVAAKTITIHFVDDKGNKLHDDTTATTATNADYDLKSTVDGVPILGYTRQTTDDALKGTAKVDANGELLVPAVTIVYTADDQNLTIHYVDDKGNTLHDDSSVPTATDADYDLKPTVDGVTIPGYTRKATDVELKGKATLGTDGKLLVPAVTVVYTADDQNLTIHYVDDKGNTLHDDSSVPTATDADYDLKSTVDGVTIPGYTRKTTDEELKGTAKLNSDGKVPDVTIVYTANAQDLTVHYVDDKGKKLHDDSTVPTTTDATYDVKSTVDGVDIPGYTRKTTDEELKGTAKLNSDGKVPDVTVVYTANAQNLTVHYVDVNGKTLHEDSSVPTATDADYDLKSTVDGVDIPGYTRKTTDEELKGTAKLNSDGKVPDVTVVYTANAQKLTIHYVDLNGNQLHDDTTFPTTTDADYDLKSTVDGVTIPGYYQRQTTDDELKGTATVDVDGKLLVPEVTVTYKALTKTIHVHYVNNLSGEDLLPSSEITKNLGELYTASAPVIRGYSLMPGTVSLVMDVMAKDTDDGTEKDADDVFFRYQPNMQVPDETATKTVLTMHYVDVDNNVIAGPTTQTGRIGDDFSVSAPEIQNYHPQYYTPVSGTYQGNAMDLTFVYDKNGQVVDDAATPATLTVHYTNVVTGEPAQPDKVTTGNQGTAFREMAPTIAGYRIQGDDSAKGTYHGNAMDLTFSYLPDGTVVDETATPTTLTVHYVNMYTGESIQADKVSTGTQDTEFTETAPTIAGYRIQGDDSENGTYQGNTMDLTFSYLQDGKTVDETATPTTLTVHYVNMYTGESIQADKVTTGTQDTEFTETAPTIAGYRIQGDDSATGTYQGNTMDLTFSYLQDGKTVDETATPTTLTVHYVNVLTGETIQADKVTTAAQGTAFTETAPAIAGYRIQGDDSAEGTYQGNAMNLIFSYLQDGKTVDETPTPATLTVHYVNIYTGESIQADKVTTGTQGTAFTETAPTIAGYRIQGDDSATGTYQGNAMNLTFSYLQDGKTVDETANPTTLTVHYVNVSTGETIQTDKVTTGAQGTVFTETAPTIGGYRIQGDDSATGTYQGNAMDLTFSYLQDGTTVDDTATPATLTVHYVNALTGESIQADKVTTAAQGTAFTETAPEIAGYRIQGADSAKGTYQGNAMNLTFTYLQDGKTVDDTATPATLTVHYVNVLTGEAIQADKVTTAAQGTAFTEAAPAIAGYRIQGSGSETGTYQGNAMALTFSYLPDGQVVDETASPATLTVHYVNVLTGEAIQADKVTTGAQGTTFTEAAPVIAGYRIQGADSAKGTYQGNTMDLTFSYLPDGRVVDETKTQVTLTVRYVDVATGATLIATKTTSGQQGTAFAETAPTIAGYHLIGESAITGTYQGNVMTVTFNYEADAAPTDGGTTNPPSTTGDQPNGGGQTTTPPANDGNQPGGDDQGLTTPPTNPEGQLTTDGSSTTNPPLGDGQSGTADEPATETPEATVGQETTATQTPSGTETTATNQPSAAFDAEGQLKGQATLGRQSTEAALGRRLPTTGERTNRSLGIVGVALMALMSLLGFAGERKRQR
ncbi:MucBP domain-containing protein [Lacticaseibacillus jixianensis]|uniref:MucBP domain-containing protein n=1 Tax=Lacticaseibacillus jixianensis TaxID=2486012 RepID=A0ABW4B9B9_9LACO|nr:MucBP domain-containing protein [Lacticaseibacillus jixianensis]